MKLFRPLLLLIFSFFIISKAYAENKAVILIYHHFNHPKQPSTSIKTDTFKWQLDYLEQNNFNVWPLTKLVWAIKYQKPIPEKTVVITVDDAWRSVYTEAYPLIKQKGWPMTVFVNTLPVDKNLSTTMTWDQMREMSRHGIEFGNHSATHDYLIRQENESYLDWRKRALRDIIKAEKRLKEEIGIHNSGIKIFSYPFGEFSSELANLLAKLNYHSVAQNSGAVGHGSDLRTLSRFPMNDFYADKEAFIRKINTYPLPVLKNEPFNPVATENPPTLILTFDKRLHGINCFDHMGNRLNMEWISDTELKIQSPIPLNPPRDRYACTRKHPSGHWQWYSHSWVIKH